MDKVTALIDGSTYSSAVCDNAAWIASRTGAEIELLHVLEHRETVAGQVNLSGNIALGARTALLNELSELDARRARVAQKLGWAILEDAQARIAAQDESLRVRTRLRIGNFVETVNAQEAESDLVIVGKRGEAANFETLELGSNLERVARARNRPVFVSAREFRPIARVLISFDGGSSSLKAVDYVSRSTLFSGLECHVAMAGSGRPQEVRALTQACAQLEAGSFKVTSHVVQGDAGDVISRAVEESRIDLLIMGAFSHSRLRSMILGSTTRGVLMRCQIPIVLIH